MNKALELAEYLESDVALTNKCDEAAAELRRLAEIENEHRALLVNEQNLREELQRMTYDRDSWEQQASDRVDDAVKFAQELEALKATLAASCDDERAQLWEATPGGGCSRALDAERELAALKAAMGAPVARMEVKRKDDELQITLGTEPAGLELPTGKYKLYAPTNKETK